MSQMMPSSQRHGDSATDLYLYFQRDELNRIWFFLQVSGKIFGIEFWKHISRKKNAFFIHLLIFFMLTNSRLETPKRVIGKQCRPRSDAGQHAASDQGLQFANTCSSTIFLSNI